MMDFWIYQCTTEKKKKKINVTSINRLGKLHKYNFEQDWEKKF